MKTSLWSVIVLVAAIVGFLVGYTVSSYGGARRTGEAQAGHGAEAAKPPPAPGGGYGAEKQAAPAEKQAAPQAPAAGGYGAVQTSSAKKPATPAAGY